MVVRVVSSFLAWARLSCMPNHNCLQNVLHFGVLQPATKNPCIFIASFPDSPRACTLFRTASDGKLGGAWGRA